MQEPLLGNRVQNKESEIRDQLDRLKFGMYRMSKKELEEEVSEFYTNLRHLQAMPTSLPSEEAHKNQALKQLSSEVEQLVMKQQPFQEALTQDSFNNPLLEERRQAIHKVQNTMEQIHQIFLDVSAEVQKQGSYLESIQGHSERAAENTQLAFSELEKASEKQNKRKWLWRGMLLGALVIVVVLVLIVYLKL